jgi:N-acetyltransferase
MKLFETDFRLESKIAQMRPMRASDLESYREIVFNDRIWKYFTSIIATEGDLVNMVESAIRDRLNQTRLALVTIDKRTGRICGSSSFGNISFPDRRLEIGWTWVHPDSMGTGLNRHAKYVMMKYAFEELGFVRVEFKTDVLNTAARTALKKAGAQEEGVLRNHTQMHSDRRRDTIYYSVLNSEWPALKNTIYADFD